MFISKKKFEAKIGIAEARGFVEGYEAGYKYGRECAMHEKHSINQIRAVCGLPPMPDGKKADSITVDESSKEE